MPASSEHNSNPCDFDDRSPSCTMRIEARVLAPLASALLPSLCTPCMAVHAPVLAPKVTAAAVLVLFLLQAAEALAVPVLKHLHFRGGGSFSATSRLSAARTAAVAILPALATQVLLGVGL